MLNNNGGIYGIYYNNELLYVGKTNQPFQTRFSQHKIEIKSNQIHTQFYNYCRQKNISINDLILIPLFECNDCPLSNEQLECLETNYINKYKPLCNERKINKNDTIIQINKGTFPQLNETQQEWLLYYYNNLSKASFGVLLSFLMFDGISTDNYDKELIQTKLKIKKTAFYDAIKDIKQLQEANK